MAYKCIGGKVTGHSHVLRGTECQDAFRIENCGYTIISVADGHGSPNCPYSAEGAQIAVDTAIDVIRAACEAFVSNYDVIKDEFALNIPRRIEQEWKKAVQLRHDEAERSANDNVFFMYGTTVLALTVTENFIAALQLGDGDILCVSEDMETYRLIESKFLFGNCTDSLCQNNAWADMRSFMTKLSESSPTPRLFLLSTDGYSNSFPDDDEFLKIGSDYLHKLDEDEEFVETSLQEWLEETSKDGSGDDITLVLLYRKPL